MHAFIPDATTHNSISLAFYLDSRDGLPYPAIAFSSSKLRKRKQ
jgi:hypothetical protein